MRSIQKNDCDEKELKVLISSLKNVLSDVPYDFMYDEEIEEDSDEKETDNI